MLIPGAFAVAGGMSSSDQSATDAAAQQARDSKARCAAFARTVVTQIQQYVDGFDAAEDKSKASPSLPSIAKFRQQAGDVVAQVGQAGCDPADFRVTFGRRLGQVEARGTLGTSVRDLLVANARDVLGPSMPRRVVVAAGADLSATLAKLPTGSTVVLPAGRFRLDHTLLVAQDLTVVGVGRGQTRILSSAGVAAVMLVAPVRLRLQDLTITHRSRRPASVLAMRAGRTEVDHVGLNGARAAQPTAPGSSPSALDLVHGGHGIIVVSAESLVVRDSAVTDNDAGGVVVSGRSAPRLVDVDVARNGVCGLCFLGRSAGTVRAGHVSGNGIGVVLGGHAAPSLHGTVISGNTKAGVITQQRSHPLLVGNTIENNGQLGVAAYGRSAPVLRGNTFGDNSQAAMVFLGTSRGQTSGNHCSGGGYGVVLDGSASPDLGDPDCTVQDQRMR